MDHLESEEIEIVPVYLNSKRKPNKISKSQLYSNTPSDFDFKLRQTATPLSEKTLVKLLNVVLAEDYEVVQSKTSDEAFERSVSLRPQLIIIDDALPGLGGIALCGKLRRNPATRHTGILILSANGDMTFKISAFEAGADEFLTKPFDSKELTYRVKNLVSRVQMPTEAEIAPVKHGRVIACFGTKGGVGKTTVAVNTALALHRQSGGRVGASEKG